MMPGTAVDPRLAVPGVGRVQMCSKRLLACSHRRVRMPVGIVGSAHLAANPARCCGGPGLAADKRSGVDPFVIALAMVNQGTVVTEENATGNIAKPRIPDVCDALGVPCLTLIGYIEAQVDILSLQGSRHDGPNAEPPLCQECAKTGNYGPSHCGRSGHEPAA